MLFAVFVFANLQVASLGTMPLLLWQDGMTNANYQLHYTVYSQMFLVSREL